MAAIQYIKAGEGVIGSVRSANRDPDMFPVPDRFDIHRMICPSQNLAFGYGPHRCQGQWLSRLELEVALGRILSLRLCNNLSSDIGLVGALIKRLPSLRLAAPFDTLEYTPPTQNVGLMHLPVYF
ncbi:Cytochrome p450 [Aspergillus sclerotialis]|uniref:Cytochrome p450 n=1 Tax=Aspergillus sclerotialis TaxID=2070753 RepID=A0A3A3A5M2_9EURO|nr:Cytochrome p450 [Aspergillus sclerotialis]